MKTRPLTFKRLGLLLTSASGLALLAACDDQQTAWAQLHEAVTGERPAQEVSTERRRPILNEHSMAQTVRTTPPAPVQQASPQQATGTHSTSPETDPYDYYDASGNLAPQPQETAESDSSIGDFFGHLFHSDAAQPEARKPLPGNPHVAARQAAPEKAETVPAPIATARSTPEKFMQTAEPTPLLATQDNAAPAASEPQPETLASAEHPETKPERSWFERLFSRDEKMGNSNEPEQINTETVSVTAMPAEEAAHDVPATEAKEVKTDISAVTPKADDNIASAEEPSKDEKEEEASNKESGSSLPSWFPDWLGNHKASEKSANDEATPAQEPQQESAKTEGDKPQATYPKLSDVKPTPEQFKDVKAEKAQNLEQLQDERSAAQEEKASLDSEPSQQQASPAKDAPDAPATKNSPSPALKDNFADTTPLPSTSLADPDMPAEPVLLGHASSVTLNDAAGEKASKENDHTEPSVTIPLEKPAATADLAVKAPEPSAKEISNAAEPAVTAPALEEKPAIANETPLPEPTAEPLKVEEATRAPVAEAPANEQETATTATTSESPAPKTEDKPSHGQYFWEGWNLFGGKDKPEAKKENSEDKPQEATTPSSDNFAVGGTPVAIAPEKADAAPQPEGTPLPTFVPEASPVAPVVAEEAPPTASNDVAATHADALPSPQMLNEVKVLPPSRYSMRRQSADSYGQ